MQKRMKVIHILLILTILATAALMACGGGGGGGSSSKASYTGLTTQAVIDENNAEELSTGAYQGGQKGAVLSSVGALQVEEEVGSADSSRTVKVSRILKGSLERMDLIYKSNGVFSGAIYTESDKFYGDCGGSAAFKVQVNDNTGSFSGDCNFSSYCEDEVTISGATSFSGEIDLNSETLKEFTFVFDNITGTMGSDSFTLDGAISFNTKAASVVTNLTMFVKDNKTAKTYFLEDYEMMFTEGRNYVDVEISGRYYDPDHGYTIIATTPLQIYYSDYFPSSGNLVVTGKTGIGGGSTKARLTALSSTSYQVEADTNGDGTYDWNSGILDWLDL